MADITVAVFGSTPGPAWPDITTDPTYGNGVYAGPAFAPWDYVLLGPTLQQGAYDATASAWFLGVSPPLMPVQGEVVADLAGLKRLVGALTTNDDDLLGWALDTATEWIYERTMQCDWAHPDVQYAILLLASRLYSRRKSPDGSSGFGPEGAVVRVLASDPDIARLIERHLECLTVGIG